MVSEALWRLQLRPHLLPLYEPHPMAWVTVDHPFSFVEAVACAETAAVGGQDARVTLRGVVYYEVEGLHSPATLRLPSKARRREA